MSSLVVRRLSIHPLSVSWRVGLWGMLVLLVLLGGWLAARPAPLHEDEAIYAAWARAVAHGEDSFLTSTPVDKPPLYLYALAGTFRLLGETPTAARSLNLVIMLGIALLVANLSRRPAVSVAVLVVTPLVSFLAASAFTDPLMVLLALLGWRLGREARPGLAGLACGLAAAAKPTALFLWPLAAGAALKGRDRDRARRFLLGLALPLAFLWAWDVSRAVPSWWQLGWQAYGTLGRGPVGMWAWWQPALLSLGVSWLALGWDRARWRTDAEYALAWGLVLGWIPLHALLGFQPWDRYLLPLAVLVAWLAGETGPRHRIWGAVAVNAGLLLLLLLVPHPMLAGRDGRWDGIEEMAALLKQTNGPVYHREIGRPLAFYAPELGARLVWLPEDQNPPAGALWAGRRWDAACGRVLWHASSGLALCRVGEVRSDGAGLVGSTYSP